jgi:hypothetical protein
VRPGELGAQRECLRHRLDPKLGGDPGRERGTFGDRPGAVAEAVPGAHQRANRVLAEGVGFQDPARAARDRAVILATLRFEKGAIEEFESSRAQAFARRADPLVAAVRKQIACTGIGERRRRIGIREAFEFGDIGQDAAALVPPQQRLFDDERLPEGERAPQQVEGPAQIRERRRLRFVRPQRERDGFPRDGRRPVDDEERQELQSLIGQNELERSALPHEETRLAE